MNHGNKLGNFFSLCKSGVSSFIQRGKERGLSEEGGGVAGERRELEHETDGCDIH